MLRAQVSRAEMMLIESKAKTAGMRVGNYVRSLLGLPERTTGRPTRAQMEAEQDHAWQILQSMGLDPAPLFPADESWLDEYQWRRGGRANDDFRTADHTPAGPDQRYVVRTTTNLLNPPPPAQGLNFGMASVAERSVIAT